jgi:hypothetical protein
MARRKIKVVYKKLGRTKSWGMAYPDDELVEVDERLKGKKRMEIIVHECLHLLFPKAEEDEIERKAVLLTNTLWHEGYRGIDNTNSIPLQDGKK